MVGVGDDQCVGLALLDVRRGQWALDSVRRRGVQYGLVSTVETNARGVVGVVLLHTDFVLHLDQ